MGIRHARAQAAEEARLTAWAEAQRLAAGYFSVSGEGWVRGPEPEHTAITADQGAFWENGEEHESGSDTGMVALVIEGDTLDPDQLLRLVQRDE